MSAKDDRSIAERYDLAGAAAIVVGALALSLVVIVVSLCAAAFVEGGVGDAGPMLADLADKLVTGLLGMLAATRLNQRAPDPSPIPTPVVLQPSPELDPPADPDVVVDEPAVDVDDARGARRRRRAAAGDVGAV